VDSTLYEAADEILTDRLGYPLGDWLTDQKEAGHSLRKIRDDLLEIVGFSISPTTVSKWLHLQERETA